MRLKMLAVSAGRATIGVVGASATASAGCVITLELHDRGRAGVAIDSGDTDVRSGGAGWFKRLGSGTTHVGAGDTVRQNFTADLGCGLQHQYRLDVNHGACPRMTPEDHSLAAGHEHRRSADGRRRQ